MQIRSLSASRWTHVVLLLAALLHLAVDLPVAPQLVLPGISAARTDPRAPRKAPPAHDERYCPVCQAFGAAAALPVPAPLLPFVTVAASADLATPSFRYEGAPRPRARARAPPVLTV